MTTKQRRGRRAGVEDRWTKTVRDPDGTERRVPSAKHGKGSRWRARYVAADGTETERLFTRKTDAAAWLDEITSTIVTGTYVAPGAGTITVAQMHTQWVGQQGHIKQSTRAARASAWATHVEPVWAETAVAEIQTSAVRSWVADLAENSAAPTVEAALGVLRMILTVAVEDRRIPRNPCDGVKAPRREHAARPYLTHQQVAELANTMHRDGDLALFLAYTGLRYGEAAALQVQDLDMLRRRVNVRRSVTEVRGKLTWSNPKEHERRSVPFPKFLAAQLARRMEGKAREDLVFQAPAGGTLRINTFRRRVFKPAVEACQAEDDRFPALTPHDLRHTAASLAIQAQATPKSVQLMLGHKSAALTLDTYADLFPDDLEAVADALDAAARAALGTAAGQLRATADQRPE